MFPNDTVDELVRQLSDAEKIALLAGKDFWQTANIDRLGIPSIKFTDGPNGLRGASHLKSIAATCIPCGTALAATWDKKGVKALGALLSGEAKAKSSSAVLAPTVNIQRSPLNGRAFECLSEDPFLSGHSAAAFINGLQESGTGAVIKHFVANDQEHERRLVDSRVDERALREVYLMPFMIVQREADPWGVMMSYGRLDGIHCAENPRLMKTILRDEWKYQGLVVSDWYGIYSCPEAIKAGLDLEMPGPSRWRGPLVDYSLACGKLHPTDLDTPVKNILNLVKRCWDADPEVVTNQTETSVMSDQSSLLNRRVAASSVVLLKNDDNILPLDPKTTGTVALIGPNMKGRVYSGGGSALLTPSYFVSPYEGITNRLEHARVKYSPGCCAHRNLPLLSGLMRHAPCANAESGWSLEWSNDADFGRILLQDSVQDTQVRFRENLPAGLNVNNFFIRLDGYFTPDESGPFLFGLCLIGQARLYVDGKLIIDMYDKPQRNGTAMYGLASEEIIGEAILTAGVPAHVKIEYKSVKAERIGPVSHQPYLLAGGLRLGGLAKVEDELAEIAASAELASKADVTIVCVGLSSEWESEASDRKDLSLPGYTDLLVEQVLARQPNAIIVNISGSAVAMPWADRAKTIIQQFFSGNESGNALADVIFGSVNPSGKLPITFPKRDCDVPAYGHFRSENNAVYYSEGLYVGYKWYQHRQIEPLFAFGHGLSYTSFEYKDITARIKGKLCDGGSVTVDAVISNTGGRAGNEIAQVYIQDMESTLHRPVKELKGYEKVWIEAGGQCRINFRLDRNAFAFYDDRLCKWKIEPGEFAIHVGGSSDNLPLHAVVSFDETHGCTWDGV